jgi:hypothetical protein
VLVYQTFTFQGVRYGLFNYNTTGAEGGFADFDSIDVYQPHTHGLMRPIPYGRSIRLTSFHATTGLAAGDGAPGFGCPDAVRGRRPPVGPRRSAIGPTLCHGRQGWRVTLAAGQSGTAQNFQWIETPTGELVLMSLATNRFLRIDPTDRGHPGRQSRPHAGRQRRRALYLVGLERAPPVNPEIHWRNASSRAQRNREGCSYAGRNFVVGLRANF